jgi:hypothetical protein
VTLLPQFLSRWAVAWPLQAAAEHKNREGSHGHVFFVPPEASTYDMSSSLFISLQIKAMQNEKKTEYTNIIYLLH